VWSVGSSRGLWLVVDDDDDGKGDASVESIRIYIYSLSPCSQQAQERYRLL